MIIYHQDYLKHVLSFGHPESPERLNATVKKLNEEKLWDNVLEPKEARIEHLRKVHDFEYIEAVKNQGFIGFEAPVHADTFRIAALAAGGAILAATESYENKKTSFALVRPPGHHAGKDYGGGFCYFNNIAIATKVLNKRAEIIDIDLHHGNGTSDIFYEDDKVLYISIHQYGIYPGTGYLNEVGKGKGEGFTINIPFTSGCGDSSYTLAFEKVIEPATEQFKPEIILVSFGSDAHYMDPLGGLALSTSGYLEIAKKIIKLSNELCERKAMFLLEGGYHLEALAECVATIIGAMQNKQIESKFNDVRDVSGIGTRIIEKIIEVQKRYWRL
ncbi:MAG: histone deacetylase [Candidatus Thermoplasmatota archaeon]|nr:histone deacetylase [Candidatus Thermoplasmatota archaeon]